MSARYIFVVACACVYHTLILSFLPILSSRSGIWNVCYTHNYTEHAMHQLTNMGMRVIMFCKNKLLSYPIANNPNSFLGEKSAKKNNLKCFPHAFRYQNGVWMPFWCQNDRLNAFLIPKWSLECLFDTKMIAWMPFYVDAYGFLSSTSFCFLNIGVNISNILNFLGKSMSANV